MPDLHRFELKINSLSPKIIVMTFLLFFRDGPYP
jgi:hypothetical protein